MQILRCIRIRHIEARRSRLLKALILQLRDVVEIVVFVKDRALAGLAAETRIDKAGKSALKAHLDRPARLARAVFADDDFGLFLIVVTPKHGLARVLALGLQPRNALALHLLFINLVAIDKKYDVGVLFDRAAFAQIT